MEVLKCIFNGKMSDFCKLLSKNPRKICAFTLAEVLITLGIIGVVAAMTIPTLVNNSQKKTYVTQLKKFYTTQNNGWKELLAADGVEKLEDTTVFSYAPTGTDDCGPYNSTTTTCALFFKELQKYFRFKIVTAPSNYITYFLYGQKDTDDSNNKVLAFPDGSIILMGSFRRTPWSGDNQDTIKAMGGHLFNVNGYDIGVDVNGFKKPNTWGRDIFFFYLSDDGILYPAFGRDYSLFEWGDLSQSQSGVGKYRCLPFSSAFGDSCAAKIMEEGWEMNY